MHSCKGIVITSEHGNVVSIASEISTKNMIRELNDLETEPDNDNSKAGKLKKVKTESEKYYDRKNVKSLSALHRCYRLLQSWNGGAFVLYLMPI